MATNLPKQRVSGWNLPNETVTDEDSIALAGNTVSQQEILPHDAGEFLSISATLSAQDFQSQGPWATIETATEPVYFDPGHYSHFNPDSFYVSATSTLPSCPTGNCPGTEVMAVNSEIGSNFVPPQIHPSGMYYDCSNRDSILSSVNLESYEYMMDGQHGAEQLHLNHRPTASFGVEDLQQGLEFQSGVSQLHDPIRGSVLADAQLEIPSLPLLDLGQSLPSSISYFDSSAAAASTFNNIPDLDVELSNQNIWGDMTTQWGSSSYLGTSSPTEAFNSLGQEHSSVQNSLRVSERPGTTPKPQLPSAITGVKDQFPTTFGPSRMVSLPPARKGGRKGPLSVDDLRKRREARKQGVCIRCRQAKEKCHGGFPCIRCRENSKAVLWKFPCTKAQFLDLLERGSYFQDISAWQTNALEIMDQESFLLAFQATLGMVSLGHSSSKITAEVLGFMQATVSICWRRSLQIFSDIAKQALTNNKFVTGRQLIEAPYILAQSTSSSPPIIIDETDLSRSTQERMSILGLFCASQFSAFEDTTNTELPPNVALALENTVKILVWISRRYYEVILFRSLQEAANRLNSLGPDELSQIAKVLLDVLRVGSLELCKREDTFMYQISNSCIVRENAYVGQMLKIRKALFIYLSITVDKLPAWCEFWQMNGISSKGIGPALSKNHLTDLETFDQYYERELMWAKMHSFLLLVNEDFESTPDLCDEVEHFKNSAHIERKACHDAIREIFNGPRNTEADLEASVKILSDYYQPMLERIEELFTMLEGSTSDSAPPISFSKTAQAVRSLVLLGRDIRQTVEMELQNQPTSRKRKSVCSDACSLLEITLEFMIEVDRIGRIVWTVLAAVSKLGEDISQ